MERGAQLEEFCRTEHVLGLAEPYNPKLKSKSENDDRGGEA
jgi:hypothetical protein